MKQVGLLHKVLLLFTIFIVSGYQTLAPTWELSIAKAVETFEVDSVISIHSPQNNGLLNKKEVTISGIVNADDGTTLNDVSVFVDTKEVKNATVNSDGSWEATLTLTEGKHEIYAVIEMPEGSLHKSNIIMVMVDSIAPIGSVESPKNNSYLNKPIFTGTVESNASLMLCLDCKLVNSLLVGAKVEVAGDSSGKWKYNIPQLSEGIHILYTFAVDQAGNEGPIVKTEFTYDNSRPIVKPSVLPKQDMTRVALDTVIVIELLEQSPIDMDSITKSITLTLNGADTEGDVTFNSEKNQLIFTPLKPLLPSSTYLVTVNPTLLDLAGNQSLPRFWSFTTISDSKLATENPHGSYQSNVNTCRNCHETHMAAGAGLMDQTVLTEPKEINDKVVDNYCMACHDGTVAPIASGALSSHTHDYGVNKDFSINKGSCSGCHNPHLEWSEDNPNIVADHFTYQHVKPNDEVIEAIPEHRRPNYDAPISSREQLCESCHERDSISKTMNEEVVYSVYSYKKWHTAEGIVEDYELCLRCHNANYQEKNIEISNIADFYNNLTAESKKQFEEMNKKAYSSREITSEEKQFSGHIIKAKDGSTLAGHIPCAECHDTHGSSNIMQLKEKIGHENKGEFKVLTGEWDDAKERNFCLSCHNGETGLYGIKIAKLSSLPKIGEKLQTGHNADSTESCSSCHTDSYDSKNPAQAYMEAAHAPKKRPMNMTTNGK
jgi:hypothetical protein